MPKHHEDLDKVFQIRVSKSAFEKIKRAAQAAALPMAVYARQLLYREAGVIKKSEVA